MTTHARVAPWSKQLPACYNRCVTEWLRSSFCTGGTCVEIAGTPEAVLLRDGKNPQQPPSMIDHAAWADFTAAIRAGEFDTL